MNVRKLLALQSKRDGLKSRLIGLRKVRSLIKKESSDVVTMIAIVDETIEKLLGRANADQKAG
jgi:hypothetical protein